MFGVGIGFLDAVVVSYSDKDTIIFLLHFNLDFLVSFV